MELFEIFEEFKKHMKESDHSPQELSKKLMHVREFLMYLATKELKLYPKLREEEKNLNIKEEARALILKGYHYNEREKILRLQGSVKYNELKTLSDQVVLLREVVREMERLLFYEIELMKADMRLSGQGHFGD